MGTIDQKLNDYVWEHISLLEAIFSEKIYKILLRFKDKEDRESFSDTLEAVVEVDDELFDKLKILSTYRIDEKINLADVYYQMGLDYLDKKKYDKVIEKSQKVIDINPNEDRAYIIMGIAYKGIEEYDKAIKSYKKAIKINSKGSSAYINMGIVYRHKEEYDEAIASYKKAIEFNPEQSASYNNMANIYRIKEEYSEAIVLYQKALSLNYKYSDTIKNLSFLMNKLNRAFFLNKTFSNLNFFINKIKIQNFKQYNNFSINFSKQINIIIGQNAIGKTTLLQAITLGLLKEDSSDTKQVEFDDYISKGQEKSELIIYHNNEEKKVEISKGKREIEENYFIPFVLAYGSNFFTSNTNEVKEVAQGIVTETIHKDFTSSIFVEYTNGFVNPITLLQFLDLEKDDKVPQIQQTFIKTINSFLEEFELISDDKNYYFNKNNLDIPLKLKDLSEGYRGNVLLITDMLIKILGVGETPKSIEGIILIDEFDKHLHPKWQSKLVNQLTETFPKIQFIMTTHNPMSILDRNADEVTKLIETKDGIKAVQGKGTKNIDVSIVLLEYFGVESTVSETMQKHINDFNRLKLKKELSEKETEELKELEQFLGNTVASNLIYNRPYLKFLEFMRDHKEIDFDRYEKMDDEERTKLLEEFGDLFDD